MAEATTTTTVPTTPPSTQGESVEPKNTPSLVDLPVSKSKRPSRVVRSRSRKSESASKTSQSQTKRQTDRPKTYRRSRILRRYFEVRDFEKADLKYVYADHRLRGGEQVEPAQFEQYFYNKVHAVDHIWSIVDENEKLIGVIYQGGNERSKETHASWMDWASPRDILTAAVSFAEKMRRRQNIMLIVPKDVDRFVEQLMRYHLFRRVGTIYKYYPDKSDAYFWQSNEK